jgi:putative hydrolase of the HAD superfamily
MIPRARVRAVAFDFGGTLFTTRKMGTFTPAMNRAFISSVGELWKVELSEAERVLELYRTYWIERRVRGAELPERETSSADLMTRALQESGFEADLSRIVQVLNAFHHCEAELFQPFLGVREMLGELAGRGLRLGIVSNNPWRQAIATSLEAKGLGSYIGEIIVSGELGYRKPHPAPFATILERWSLSAENVLFVGDSYRHDIEVPRRLGFQTCLVDFDGTNKNDQASFREKADFFITSPREIASIVF